MSKELERILDQKKITPTAMRLLILEFLLPQKTAVSLPLLEQHFNYSDRTTLYRTLKTFEEKFLIHSINDGSGCIKYALCQDDCAGDAHTDIHLHFNCIKCKETFCLPRTRMPQIKVPSDFELQEVSLIARGLCKDCKAKDCN